MFGFRRKQAQPTEQPKQAYIVSRNAECWTQGKEILEQAHIMIAGTTGCGKSTLLKKLMWTALAFTPGRMQFIIVDMKMGIEMKQYAALPHTLRFARNGEDAISALDYAIRIMTDRCNQMYAQDKVMWEGSDIYVVIDELADLLQVCGSEAIDRLTKIGRLGRAARIHLLLATQAPQRDRKSGLCAAIQQNMTCTIGMRCRTATESRQIIGVNGCESLPKYGTAYLAIGADLWMLPIVPISDEEGRERIAYWSDPANYTVYA